MTVLVDSDILIEVSRGRNSEIVSRWLELSWSSDPILCTPVNVAELWVGVREGEEEPLAALFNVLLCIPMNAEIGRLAGSFIRRYRKSHSIELGDALVAASAVVHSAALWTRNRKHYPMNGLNFF